METDRRILGLEETCRILTIRVAKLDGGERRIEIDPEAIIERRLAALEKVVQDLTARIAQLEGIGGRSAAQTPDPFRNTGGFRQPHTRRSRQGAQTYSENNKDPNRWFTPKSSRDKHPDAQVNANLHGYRAGVMRDSGTGRWGFKISRTDETIIRDWKFNLSTRDKAKRDAEQFCILQRIEDALNGIEGSPFAGNTAYTSAHGSTAWDKTWPT